MLFPSSLGAECGGVIRGTTFIADNDEKVVVRQLKRRAGGRLYLNFDCEAGAATFPRKGPNHGLSD